mgnify:CR=1 FL=1
MIMKLTSFVLAFLLLACTITAISAAMFEIPEQPTVSEAEKTSTQTEAMTQPDSTEPKLTVVEEHPVKDSGYTPRVNAPDPTDPRYYSDDNIFYAADYGMPNCTCYAWGRAYEITGEKPELSPYDACTWYAYNAENSIYDYADEPQEGAIACFAYADGGSGHVAVVEEVADDTLLLSNSAYSGTEFYLDTVPADDPSGGREGWIFQGYIYVDG